jgi:hypothetical protein
VNIPAFFSSLRHVRPVQSNAPEAKELFAVCRLDAAQCCEQLENVVSGYATGVILLARRGVRCHAPSLWLSSAKRLPAQEVASQPV